jgi:hypothetical protein
MSKIINIKLYTIKICIDIVKLQDFNFNIIFILYKLSKLL